MALLGVTAQVINEYRAVEAARQIVTDTKELQTRLAKFAKHLGDVGKKLNTAVNGYNVAVGSWESRLVPQVNKVAGHGTGGPEAPSTAAVETPAGAEAMSVEDLAAERGQAVDALAERLADLGRLDTRFDTASITKLFTSVSVLQLID